LARLLGFAASRLRSPVAPPVDRVVYAIDRDQSAIENYGVAIWFVATLICYVGFFLPFRAPFDILAAVVIAPLSVQIANLLAGGAITLMGMKNNVAILSAATMSVMIAISSYLATATAPVRFVACFFLFVVAYEEPALRRKFGQAYDRYCDRVPRWIPQFRADRGGRSEGR